MMRVFVKTMVLSIMLCLLPDSLSAEALEDNSNFMESAKAGLSSSIARTKRAALGDFSGVFVIRLKLGHLALPKDFVLHVGDTRGWAFRVELDSDLQSTEREYARLRFWNKEQNITALFDQAMADEQHLISTELEKACGLKVEVRRIDTLVPATTIPARYIFLDLGTQVMSATSSLEPLLVEMFRLFADMNCGPDGQKQKWDPAPYLQMEVIPEHSSD